jgi:large subunit ribosomal protein L54
VKKVVLSVETDPAKLAKYCCGLNINKTGGEEVELKPDSEYPEWLFKMTLTGRGPDPEDMDKNTMQYWSRVRRLGLRHKNKMMKNQFPQPFIPKKISNMRLA